MHTEVHGLTVFHYNADLSGNVIINAEPPGKPSAVFEVPGSDLLDFICGWIVQ